MTTFIGIDPGMSGALAIYSPEAHGSVSVADMPVLAAGGKKGRRIVDVARLVSMLRRMAVRFPDAEVTLEEVRSMPRDGHVGAFAFGRCFGTIETAIVAAGLPYRMVPPQVWKRKLGVTADKDHARAIASRLLPGGASLWPLKKHDGRAEAALIAYYGAKYALSHQYSRA